MALPNLVDYRQTASGFYFKNSDGTGPYAWDGTTMKLMDDDGAITGSVTVSSGTVTATVTGFDADSLVMASANFTRPADTTAYSVGDLVANNVTAGSVAAMQFTVTDDSAGAFIITKGRLKKTGTSAANAFFDLHLYSSSPTPSNGDNGAWLTNNSANYLGKISFGQMTVFTDGCSANGTPAVGSQIAHKLSSGQIIYGLLEARGAYTPASAEQFTLVLESDEE